MGRLGWSDLRDWLAMVDAIGELRHIRGASSEADIGDITEMFEHTDGSPAALFAEIPGFAPTWRVLSNSMGTRRRQAITLGIDPHQASHAYLLDYWRSLLRDFKPVPSMRVDRGPILQNVQRGDQVDLTLFPAPIWHPEDGGRYIGTASVNVLRDPDTGLINAGTYRNQVLGKNVTAMRAAPAHHGGLIRQKYVQRGQECPIVIVAGEDPLLFLAACIEGPMLGQSELDWAGGIRGAPTEYVAGEVTGLPIPAHAEIALEGFITLDQFGKEGPYGEWMGFYQDGFPNERAIRVERVYHRDDPIILGSPQGKPPHEDNQFLAYGRSGMVWDQLEKAGVPGVKGVWCPPEGGNRLMVAVALETQYPGHAKQAGLIASQCAAAIDNNRLVVVVDPHVDVTDLKDVVWAMLTRCDPERDVDIIGGTKGSRLDMAIGPDERDQAVNSRMIVDATTPFAWKSHHLAGTPISNPERTRAIQERWGWLLQNVARAEEE
jgi:4-hydroxy-3-polyprenylbenzoate decarboxylase